MTAHTPVALTDEQRGRIIARALHVRLARVPHLTNLPTIRTRAEQLVRKVSQWRRHPGMLGRNGYGPAIDDVVRSAERAGFMDGTPRPAVTERLLLDMAGDA